METAESFGNCTDEKEIRLQKDWKLNWIGYESVQAIEWTSVTAINGSFLHFLFLFSPTLGLWTASGYPRLWFPQRFEREIEKRKEKKEEKINSFLRANFLSVSSENFPQECLNPYCAWQFRNRHLRWPGVLHVSHPMIFCHVITRTTSGITPLVLIR